MPLLSHISFRKDPKEFKKDLHHTLILYDYDHIKTGLIIRGLIGTLNE